MSSNVYEIVTETILDALAKGVVPWRKPWTTRDGGMHCNLKSRKPYRGINQLLLSLMPYTSAYWVTFKQATELGGTVRKGEKSTLVVFWKQLKVEDPTAAKGYKMIPMLRYYRVFNIEQCDGLAAPVIEPLPDFDPNVEAEAIVDGMPDAPPITYEGDSACYIPQWDSVKMPVRESFLSPARFYSTVFHELAHSTGHAKRLNRPEITKGGIRFGDSDYGNEELVAEMTAAMLCAHSGLFPETRDSNAAYIASWIRTIEGDPKLVVLAAAKAQRASDHIMGVTYAEMS